MYQSTKPQRGFTLIELIIVIVILGILAVVALPRFISAAKESKESTLAALAGAIESTAYLQHDIAILNRDNGGFENGFISDDGVLFDQGFPVALDFDTPGSSFGNGNGVPEILEAMRINTSDWTFATITAGSEDGQTTRELYITHRDVLATGATAQEIIATNCYVSYDSFLSVQRDPVVKTELTGCN